MTRSEVTPAMLRERLERVERALDGLDDSEDAAVRTYVAMVRAETQNLRYHLLADVEEEDA